jgi:hypothetical protein
LKNPEYLIEVRWVINEADRAAVAAAVNPVSAKMLALALGEVGISEQGTEADKRRILDYWNVTPELRDRNKIGLNNLGHWGGAFLSWVVSSAGLAPPTLSTAFNSWPSWGEDVSQSQIAPGVIAILNTGRRGSRDTELLAGVVLRRRPDCVEIVIGNLQSRVAIACVALPVTWARGAPQDR